MTPILAKKILLRLGFKDVDDTPKTMRTTFYHEGLYYSIRNSCLRETSTIEDVMNQVDNP